MASMARIAEVIEQIAEGGGTDILAARETETGEALGWRERHAHGDQPSAFFWPMRDSVPASSREMFSRCAM